MKFLRNTVKYSDEHDKEEHLEIFKKANLYCTGFPWIEKGLALHKLELLRHQREMWFEVTIPKTSLSVLKFPLLRILSFGYRTFSAVLF